MEHANLSQCDLILADEVDVNLDVLCATMVNMFGGHINNIDIVCRAQRRS